MELTANEAKVFEAIKAGHIGGKAVAAASGLNLHVCLANIRNLYLTGATKRIKKAVYEPAIEHYTIVSKHVTVADDPIVINTNVSRKVKDYIARNRQLIPRSALAKKLSITKTELNQIIIEMENAGLVKRG